MSSQGTGSTGSIGDNINELILECWGNWANDNPQGAGARKGVISTMLAIGSKTSLFTDDEMCVVDSLVAQLAPPHKRMIKIVHLAGRDVSDQAERTYRMALREFGALLDGAANTGDFVPPVLDVNGVNKQEK